MTGAVFAWKGPDYFNFGRFVKQSYRRQDEFHSIATANYRVKCFATLYLTGAPASAFNGGIAVIFLYNAACLGDFAF